ncbi:hypothetical protein [Rhizobium etli]|uniref:hypothetical protein n=1 Tax=Rhizobium etli TaxID=29449 RepID=UPI00093D0B22|nr:hypothetical protein [Rhizobium etli]
MAELNLRDKSRTAGRSGEKKRKWMDSFIPRRLEMLISPAWQRAPRPLLRLIERLEIEHLRHGGQNNGELYVSYPQFVAYGMSKKSIRSTLKLGEELGLLQVIREERIIQGDIRPANCYRLTYVPAKGKQNPTDEWKCVTEERAIALVGTYRVLEAKAVKAERRAAACP